jgi:hypothetical protein
MKMNAYKRFDPRVMEREERIGINHGLPTIEALLVFKVYFDFTTLFSIVISNHPLPVIFFDI